MTFLNLLLDGGTAFGVAVGGGLVLGAAGLGFAALANYRHKRRDSFAESDRDAPDTWLDEVALDVETNDRQGSAT